MTEAYEYNFGDLIAKEPKEKNKCWPNFLIGNCFAEK